MHNTLVSPHIWWLARFAVPIIAVAALAACISLSALVRVLRHRFGAGLSQPLANGQPHAGR